MTQTSPQPSRQEQNKINPNSNQTTIPSPDKSPLETPPSPQSSENLIQWWQKQNLRFKTSSTAIALSILPIVIVGSVIGFSVNQAFRAEIKAVQQDEVSIIGQDINLIIADRFAQVQGMAQVLPELAPYQQRNKAQLQAQLNNFKTLYKNFDTIAVFDAQGNAIAESGGRAMPNHIQRTYIQQAKQVKGAIVSEPIISEWDGTYGVYFASALLNPNTNEITGYIRARIPVQE